VPCRPLAPLCLLFPAEWGIWVSASPPCAGYLAIFLAIACETASEGCHTPQAACKDTAGLCRSYLLAYNSHQLKDIFNVHTLDLVSVAKSFGFSQPPRVGA
jgi:hypothetical protein